MKKCLMGVAAILALSSSLAAQSDNQFTFEGVSYQDYLNFDFVGGGARAEGMGNAFIAISNDITAGTWNPAGLVTLEGPMLGLSYSATSPAGYTDYSVSASNVWRRDHQSSLSALSGVDFVAPFRFKGRPLVGSFSFNRSFEDLLEMGWHETARAPIFVVRNNIIQIDTFDVAVDDLIKAKGAVNTVTFALGTRVHERVAVGLGVNVYTGRGEFERFRTNNIPGFPMPPGEQSSLITEDFYQVDSTKFSGLNFNLGVKYTHDKLTAGLVIRTPFDLNLNHNQSVYLVTSINGYPREQGTDTTFYDDMLVKYHMPLMIGAGASYQATEQLLLAMTLEYRGFGSSEIKVRESYRLDQSGQTEETFTEQDALWNNVMIVRAGCEYVKLTIRCRCPISMGHRSGPTCRLEPGFIGARYTWIGPIHTAT
ncbi:MAG: outer membrane protein transport protein [Chitinivibrionia bacterium]|nr:outer membrane protein transport protein [Chitinivibrionia bacterium]